MTPTATALPRTTADSLSPDAVAHYRRAGFVHVPGVVAEDRLADLRNAAIEAAARLKTMAYAKSVFDQCVNAWRDDPAMRELTLDPNLGAIAEKLAGVPLRLWHDQILIKQPGASKATEFHQDQPYWPHARSTHPISCWVALCDVPVERGCMTFIGGYQGRDDLAEQDLQSNASMFEVCPELTWAPRVTVPLRAGDCTFHHGRTPHMATPNLTDEPRVAHVVIYVDQDTVYTGREHVVTDGLSLEPSAPLEHELFPAVSTFADRSTGSPES
ncbi:MAG: phytanoyl-CoA dioxygenase family protein [Planctomycetota bacterium]